MTENRRYYYLKVKESFYNSETMVILESMQDGLIYSNLLMKMYLMSLKNNGVLMLNERIPHTPQTIATCTRHQIGTVERASKVFIELGLVEILTDGAYYMSDIQLMIGQSSTEGERKKRERIRLQQEKLLPTGRPAERMEQAVALIREMLSDGEEHEASECEAKLREANISSSTAKKAKAAVFFCPFFKKGRGGGELKERAVGARENFLILKFRSFRKKLPACGADDFARKRFNFRPPRGTIDLADRTVSQALRASGKGEEVKK